MRLIVVLIALIIILSVFNIDLRGLASSDIWQANLDNLREFFTAVGDFFSSLWLKITQYF